MIRAVRSIPLPKAGDVVLTVVLTLVLVLGSKGAQMSPWNEVKLLDGFGYGLLVAAALPTLYARRYPLPVLLITVAVVATYYWSDYPIGPAFLPVIVALFLLARAQGPLRAGMVAGTLLLIWLVVHVATGGPVTLDAAMALPVVLIAAVIGIGTAVRNRMAAVQAARDQAAEHESRLAEQERLRIAREVHDVVAHSLAMINVQAGVAAHVADRRPEEAVQALRNIKEASASALTDLRATLAVLRSGQDKAPMPTLVQMSELVDHAKAAGLAVRVHGSPGELPAPTDGAAYRIVQESLTNVVRHANQPKSVEISFSRHRGNLVLVVFDDGRGATEPKIGNGLRGMRERAEALGGWVRASPVDGGFEVRAELPLAQETS
ncbi:sensor histidine kinase [Amycolatopsis nigrescens]|uniref:sensor histidine kinase n=1 Tax=Amycolatopsis nigrescens TaxID=381445 RepID=UPI0003745E5A|nr:sensor histidine kinase [Amycolatopsis nigrescens]